MELYRANLTADKPKSMYEMMLEAGYSEAMAKTAGGATLENIRQKTGWDMQSALVNAGVTQEKIAEKIKVRPTEFLSEGWAWTHMADDLIAVSAWQMEDWKEAYKHGKKAVEISPEDERLVKNLAFYKEKINADTQRSHRRGKN